MPDEPYQSLYRRYRPQRFGEVRGQDHVTSALRNAVRHDRVAHAYLFSGPRGTGKTSTARILAKALNCTNLQDGEPCGECESCLAVQAGTSLDVVELDAASNNGVDAMRDLVGRAALATPGRRKVYIVDEVHMLTAGASNALLKTLEEPPAHVVFVLATTDAQKALPTIRSRTQAFEFRLLAPELLATLLADVNDRADLGLDAATLDRVVRRGNGSARDALSALDQAAAAGEAEDESDVIPAIVEALIARDAGAALVAVAEAVGRGRDPHRLAIELIEHLRSAFLVTMAPAVAGVLDHERPHLEDQARRLGTAALVRAMEVLGEILVEMREALDTRVTLEVALVRLCAPAADPTPAALLARVETLERRLAEAPARPNPETAGPPKPETSGRPSSTRPGRPAPDEGRPPAPPRAPAPPPNPRPTIGAMRQAPAATREEPPPAAVPPVEAAGSPPAGPAHIDRDELTKVWGDRIFPGMSPGVRSLYRMGRWTAVDDGVATFVLPGKQYRDRAEDKRPEVEAALAAHFGTRLTVRLDVDEPQAPTPRRPSGAAAPGYEGPLPEAPPEEEEEVSAAEFAELPAAPEGAASAEAWLMERFPGTTEVTG